jgi:predicted esterase
MNQHAWILLGSIIAGSSGCRSSSPALADESRTPSAYFESSVPLALAADRGPREEDSEKKSPSDGPFIKLQVRGFGPAIVSIPRRGTRPRPVLVATHGAGDRPEWQCNVWRTTVQDRGFVLCPRGQTTNAALPEEATGYYYPDHENLGDELTASLAALAERFPGEVDLGGPILTGFSQGAIMGARILGEHPARFARAVLIEGGVGAFKEWSLWTARRFHEAGGVRVLFACGNPRCAASAEATSAVLGKAGVEAQVLHVEGAGHSYGGQMEEEVRKTFSWLIEGDPRWNE